LKAPSKNTKKGNEEHVTRLKKVFEAALPPFLLGASPAITRDHAAAVIVPGGPCQTLIILRGMMPFFNDFPTHKGTLPRTDQKNCEASQPNLLLTTNYGHTERLCLIFQAQLNWPPSVRRLISALV
jgi:hypothetical protein